MRGLTDQERAELEGAACNVDSKVDDVRALNRLIARGLLHAEPRGTAIAYSANAMGLLALRLDAAARAIGGLRG